MTPSVHEILPLGSRISPDPTANKPSNKKQSGGESSSSSKNERANKVLDQLFRLSRGVVVPVLWGVRGNKSGVELSVRRRKPAYCMGGRAWTGVMILAKRTEVSNRAMNNMPHRNNGLSPPPDRSNEDDSRAVTGREFGS